MCSPLKCKLVEQAEEWADFGEGINNYQNGGEAQGQTGCMFSVSARQCRLAQRLGGASICHRGR